MCKNVAAAMLGLAAVMLPAAPAPVPVAGFVFEDVNGNGRRAAGEVGLAGIAISNQHEVVESGADGAYRLTGPGYGVVFVSLPDDHRAVGSFWKAVPSASSSAPLDFALAARLAPTTFTFIHASDAHVSPQSLVRLQQVRAIAETRRSDFVLARAQGLHRLSRGNLRVDQRRDRRRRAHQVRCQPARSFAAGHVERVHSGLGDSSRRPDGRVDSPRSADGARPV
jgi:hypothetical protein